MVCEIVVNKIGQTLSSDERISLEVAVLKLSQEYDFQFFRFWGRVEGIVRNYYVVSAVDLKNTQSFPCKRYFWRYRSPESVPTISSSQNSPLPASSRRRESTRSTTISQASMRRSSGEQRGRKISQNWIGSVRWCPSSMRIAR